MNFSNFENRKIHDEEKAKFHLNGEVVFKGIETIKVWGSPLFGNMRVKIRSF